MRSQVIPGFCRYNRADFLESSVYIDIENKKGGEIEMAFFDSPKNLALWDKELESLDAEKERRKTEGYKPRQIKEIVSGSDNESRIKSNPKVRRINLKELEEIERLSRESNNGNSREHRKGRVSANRKSASHSFL